MQDPSTRDARSGRLSSSDSRLLADFVADVGVAGMEFGQGGGGSADVGESEFEFA
jgi:hypothetical protein